ncbi:hypothetical protein [Roseovarius aquimarinus]|uniref:DUF4760 domain-containing protein n=1 Tax=Roseovarius aquimarinus TaxID=1229156 RepID=A0ABW7I9D5_9RHOB
MMVESAFWVFVGVVAGAIIQFFFHYIISLSQRANAKRLFRVELEINSELLAGVEADLLRKKSLFVSGQQNETDFIFNFFDFNYRMVDPLINTGHFHAIVGADGVKAYFQFMNDLNSGNAISLEKILRRQHDENTSVRFLDHLIEVKLKQWKTTISLMRKKVGKYGNT